MPYTNGIMYVENDIISKAYDWLGGPVIRQLADGFDSEIMYFGALACPQSLPPATA